MDNRAMPRATVIPELAYGDVAAASDWLCAAFGFAMRWRIGGHRAQLNVEDGAIVVRAGGSGRCEGVSLMVRVAEIDAHHARASGFGARILSPPTDFPYGERQYSAVDVGGYTWTFSQSIADVDPASWGSTVGRL